MTAAGKKIAAARVRAKLTGKELADKAGVTAAWVRSVETGGIARPAPDKLRRVADVVGLDIRELLALTDQLGAAAVMDATSPAHQSDVAAAIREQTAALTRLAEATEAQTRALLDALADRDARSEGYVVAMGQALGDLRATIERRLPEPSRRRSSEGTPAAHRTRTSRQPKPGQARPGWEEPEPEVSRGK